MAVSLWEYGRLAALARYRVLDSFPESSFEQITAMVQEIFEAPISTISLVDRDRVWFKSHPGLRLSQIPRSDAFCTQTILTDAPLLIRDVQRDPLYYKSRLAIEEPGVRFYCGTRIMTRDGHALGALTVMDTQPRPHFEVRQAAILSALAPFVLDALSLRIAGASLRAVPVAV